MYVASEETKMRKNAMPCVEILSKCNNYTIQMLIGEGKTMNLIGNNNNGDLKGEC